MLGSYCALVNIAVPEARGISPCSCRRDRGKGPARETERETGRCGRPLSTHLLLRRPVPLPRVCLQAESQPPNSKEQVCREFLLRPRRAMPEGGRILLCACVSAPQLSPKPFCGGDSGPGRRQHTTPHWFHEASSAAPRLHGGLVASVLTRRNNTVEEPCFRYGRPLCGRKQLRVHCG